MDLLALQVTDLEQQLEKEIEENPFLEVVEPVGDISEPDQSAEAKIEDGSETDILEHHEAQSSSGDEVQWDAWEEASMESDNNVWDGEEARPSETLGHERNPSHQESLMSTLMQQLALSPVSTRVSGAVEAFIGALDDAGYLREDAGVLARQAVLDISDEEIALALTTLHGFTPAGVGARTLQECLLLQLAERGEGESLSARILQRYEDALLHHRYEEIAAKERVAPRDVQDAVDHLRQLTPRPGSGWSKEVVESIVPDFLIRTTSNGLVVDLNDREAPRLQVRASYKHLVRNRASLSPEQKEYLAARLQAATWMVQAIEQRRQTMLRVMRSIVERQKSFFEQGLQGLQPLTLREIAEEVQMHESTISRVVRGKYAQTPRGLLPLRHFFSAGLETDYGDAVSARQVRDQIQSHIKKEDVTAPLTDQDIALRLQEEGIHVARRTVAKYREQMKILSAKLRRRVI